MKEMGYNHELIQVKQTYLFGKGDAGFEPLAGVIHFSKEFSKRSNAEIAGMMRHELDHFEVYAKLAKSMGIDKFKSFLKTFSKEMGIKDEQTFDMMFNESFWNKAIKNVDVSGFNAVKYEKAIAGYYKKISGLSDYSELMQDAKYFSNSLETRAYKVQDSIYKSMGVQNDEQIMIRHLNKEINKTVELIKRKNPRSAENNPFGEPGKLEEFINEVVMREKYKQNGKSFNEFCDTMSEMCRNEFVRPSFNSRGEKTQIRLARPSTQRGDYFDEVQYLYGVLQELKQEALLLI